MSVLYRKFLEGQPMITSSLSAFRNISPTSKTAGVKCIPNHSAVQNGKSLTAVLSFRKTLVVD